MDNKDLAWEVRAYVEVTRKPFDIEDVYCKTPLSNIPVEIQNEMKKLPVIEANEYFDFEHQGFFKKVLDGDQQLYLLKDEDRIFFVDTQGYSYARYVGEIENGIELLK